MQTFTRALTLSVVSTIFLTNTGALSKTTLPSSDTRSKLTKANAKVPIPPAGKTPSAPASGTSTPPPPELSNAVQSAFDSEVQANKIAQVPNHPRQVIKYGDQFLLLDDRGLMPVGNKYGYGLYRNDTRFLSCWDITLGDLPLTLLSKNTDDGYAGRYDYTNSSTASLPGEKALLMRRVVISDTVHEELRVTNEDIVDREFNLKIRFGADFADMFEVRGDTRKKCGTLNTPSIEPMLNQVVLSYFGLDSVRMQTVVGFSHAPDVLTKTQASFKFHLKPHESWSLQAVISANPADAKAVVVKTGDSTADAFARVDGLYNSWRHQCADVVSDNPEFDAWLNRSYRDLFMLQTPLPKGVGIAAGLPWFAVAFGRDQEVTSLETLPFMPQLSKGVLEVLCAYQGKKEDTFTLEKPGRIMHELRLGEMARLREIPFIPYYGTVDATPLFLVLMGEYVDTTGDIAFAKDHWENIQRALDFLESETGDGYLRYGWGKGAALTNIGWKDSGDSVVYADGKQVQKLPIALSEVQGYLYSAWTHSAKLAERLNKPELAQSLREKAAALKQRFAKDFWITNENFVAEALDGDNKQCAVISSNPGHVLFTGLLEKEQQDKVAARLLSPEMFSGWGIRTLSSKMAAYNPLSYHNGSVWPHDNAIISAGLGKSDHSELAARVLSSMFQVAKSQPDQRLPELFCGFDTTYSSKPIWYPVSCSPQAWAAGSPFMMLQGALGLSLDAENQTIKFHRPTLPKEITKVELRGLQISGKPVNITIKSDNGKIVCDSMEAASIRGDGEDTTLRFEPVRRIP